MESLENSKVLKEIGLDEKNMWILQEEKASKFFHFIANNLDETNILTTTEIQDYEKLIESKKFLGKEELENELKNIEHSFPGFFSVTDEILEDLEDEVKQLDMEFSERSERLARMKDYEGDQLKTLSDIDRSNCEIEMQHCMLTEECIKRSKELSNLQESNSLDVAQLNKIYTQQQSTPSIMSQMPLDQYFKKCNQFLGLLEMYMNQSFNIVKGSEDVFSVEEESKIRNIYQIKSEIIELEKKKFMEEMNVAGIKYVIENIDKYKNKIGGDYHEMRSIIDTLMVEKEGLETHFNVLMLEGDMVAENIAEQKVTKIFLEFYKGKNKRASERVKKLNNVYELTDNIVYSCELLWVALQLDLNRLKNRIDNSEEMNYQSQESIKRIRQMKQIVNEDQSSLYTHQFLTSLQKLLIENLGCNKDDLSSIEKCFKEYIIFDEQVATIMQMLIEQKQLDKIQKTINKIDDQSKILRDLIYCGPTNKPRLYDPKFIIPLHDKQNKKKEFEKIFQEIRMNFNSKVFEPFSNDKYFRMKELLYIWFCTEPKKVLLAIKEVEKKAAEDGSASFKALNITVSQ